MLSTNSIYLVSAGSLNTGYFDNPIYKDNLFKDREEISSAIETLLLKIDEGIYSV